MVALKLQLIEGSFALYEVSQDGKFERRLDAGERPTALMEEWENDSQAKLFCVKKSTIVRFYDWDGGMTTYVTMDLVDRAGLAKSASVAVEYICKKRLLKGALTILEVEASYVGQTTRVCEPDDVLMSRRRAWDVSSSTSFAYSQKPASEFKAAAGAAGAAGAEGDGGIAELDAANAERKRLQPAIERECLAWMSLCLHYKFAQESFWAVLHHNDGEHLIGLCNVFLPNCIRAEQVQTERSQLALLKNLDLVCAAFERFGMDKHDVFTPEDVVERRSNVLYTLYVLATEAHRRGHPQWTTTATASYFESAPQQGGGGEARRLSAAASEARRILAEKKGAAALEAAEKQAQEAAAKTPRAPADIAAVTELASKMSVPLVHAAVKLNDIAALDSILSADESGKKARADKKNAKGQSAMHWAANLCRIEALELLIAAGADVDVVDAHHSTPLHLCCARQSVPGISLLVRAGANVGVLSSFGVTPLHVVSDNKNDDPLLLAAMLDALAARDAENVDLNLPDGEGMTPVHVCAREGRDKILATLLVAGGSLRLRSSAGDTPLLLATKVGGLSTCELLLKEATARQARVPDLVWSVVSDVDDDGNTPLHVCAALGFVDIAKLLLRNDAPEDECNNNEMSPLQVAVQAEHDEMVALLGDNAAAPPAVFDPAPPPMPAPPAAEPSEESEQEQPAPPSDDDDDDDDEEPPAPPVSSLALTEATKNKPPPPPAAASPRTLEGGVSQVSLSRPLFAAAKEGRDADVKKLLAAGAIKVDARDRNRNTALHYACREGHVKVIKKLLGARAKLTVRNRAGETCIHLAAKKLRGQAARQVLKVLSADKQRILLEHRTERDQETALHYAMRRLVDGVDDDGLADALFGCEKLPIELVDRRGMTALHIGARHASAAHVRRLLELSIARNVPLLDAVTHARETALHVAVVQDREDIVKLLLEFNANAALKNNDNQTARELAVALGHELLAKDLAQP